MEYLPGLSLADLVERHGPLPPGRVVYLLRQVCQALREAHAAGLIHRDIKPSNIFASQRGGMDDVAKLLDFGLVLPTATDRRAPTERGGPDPRHAAVHVAGAGDGRPVSWTGGATSTRSARWPTYLLTGRPPFEGEDGLRLMIAHARDPVVPPSLVAPASPRIWSASCCGAWPRTRPIGSRMPRAWKVRLGECACAGDWDQRRAARWWQTVDRNRERVRGSNDPISADS